MVCLLIFCLLSYAERNCLRTRLFYSLPKALCRLFNGAAFLFWIFWAFVAILIDIVAFFYCNFAEIFAQLHLCVEFWFLASLLQALAFIFVPDILGF